MGVARWSNGCTKLLLWIQTLICKTKAHILWKWGKKMSLMRFCEQSWHSVTSEQIFLRKWKLLHLRGSDVIPLYQPTAREIKLMTNSEICRFYIFFIAKCKMGGGTVNDRIWLLIWKCWECTILSVRNVYTNEMKIDRNYQDIWFWGSKFLTKNTFMRKIYVCV